MLFRSTTRALLVLLISLHLAGCAASLRTPEFVPAESILASRVEVPLEFAGVGYPVITVMIDNRPARLMLDTGAVANILRSDYVKDTSLVVESTSFMSVDAGGRVTRAEGVAHVQTVGVAHGQLFLKDVDFLVEPLTMLHGCDGVIGLPAFGKLLLTLDLAQRRLLIERGALPAADGHAVLAMKTHPDGRWLAPFAVEGTPLWACLDSGYTATIVVPESAASKFPGAQDRLPFGSVRAWNTLISQSLAVSKADLAIGQYKIHKPVINVASTGNDITLGVGVLRNFQVTFDQPNRRVRLLKRPAAGDPILVNPLPLAGLEVDPRTCRVRSVSSGSLAHIMGFHVADEVVSIEGVPLGSFGNVPMPKPKVRDALRIELRRNGKPFSILVPLIGRGQQGQPSASPLVSSVDR